MYEQKIIENLREFSAKYQYEDQKLSETCFRAADAIEELNYKYQKALSELVAQEKPKWIPVRKRLPKDGEFVLVCNDDGHMMIAKYESETLDWFHKYTNYDFDIWDNEEQGPVLYWMPLPEPPKDGE